MTMQRPEMLRYRGRWYPLLRFPLDQCTDAPTRRRIEQLQMRSTALWRGYQGNWAIQRSKLWLTALAATIREYTSADNWTHGERGLDWLFPDGAGQPVLADWYTGELVTGMGNGARVAQFLWDWEEYRVFKIERGTVVGIEVRDNRTKFHARLAEFKEFSRRMDQLFDLELPRPLPKLSDPPTPTEITEALAVLDDLSKQAEKAKRYH